MKKFRQILEGTISSNEKTTEIRTESDAAYAASLKKIAMDKQIDSLSNRDRDTLARIADMMKNANNDKREGAFYGRDDLVKQFSTSKEQRRKNVRLVRDTRGGTERATLNKVNDAEKIAQMKKDGYKVDPTYWTDESLEETTLAQQQRDKTKS